MDWVAELMEGPLLPSPRASQPLTNPTTHSTLPSTVPWSGQAGVPGGLPVGGAGSLSGLGPMAHVHARRCLTLPTSCSYGTSGNDNSSGSSSCGGIGGNSYSTNRPSASSSSSSSRSGLRGSSLCGYSGAIPATASHSALPSVAEEYTEGALPCQHSPMPAAALVHSLDLAYAGAHCPPDLALVCRGGVTVLCYSQLLCMASPVLRDALELQATAATCKATSTDNGSTTHASSKFNLSGPSCCQAASATTIAAGAPSDTGSSSASSMPPLLQKMLCLQLSGDCDCNGDIGESTGANTDINSEAMIDSTVTGYGHGTMHGAIEVVEGLVQAAPRQQLAVDDDASDWHLLLPMLTPLCMCEGVGAWSPALEQLERLYGLADKYEMTSLMATCQAILQRMAPSPDMHSHAYALRWLHFADRYALHALYERMLQYIEDHLEDISELQELLGMTSSPKASACMRPVHGVYDSMDMRDSMDGTIVHADADAILKPMRRNTWHTAAAGSRTSAGGGCMPQVPGSMPSAADTEATGPAMPQASAAAARAADASTIAEGKGYLSLLSPRSLRALLRCALRQRRVAVARERACTATLAAEGLALDLLHGRVCVRNWERWRRLSTSPAKGKPFQLACTSGTGYWA